MSRSTRSSRISMLVFALILAMVACKLALAPDDPPPPTVTDPAPDPGAFEPIELPVGYGADGGWIEVYFTDPSNPLGEDLRGGPDERLAAAIREARLSVDVAAYSLSLWSIRDALIEAHNRGVLVRVVMESTNLDKSVPQELKDAGIPMLGDRREGLMHDKFVVIDRAEVWLGSMNFTTNGGYDDNNNLIRIRSTKVAENYTTEFDEMFVDDMFGTDRVPLTPYPSLTVNGVALEIYFSPDDGVAEHLVGLLNNAEESIFFMAYSFTADDMGEAIRSRALAGVTVAGVMEESQFKSNIGTEYDPFKQAGLDVHLDGNNGLMHHKVFVIDRSIVVTGSYNFSASAEDRNDENVIIFYSPEIAELFLAEFGRVYEAAQP
ncbi:MAG: phospholipase D-like domain-containing protein [Chloroflexota bacterium]